jgi:hypothetical protein
MLYSQVHARVEAFVVAFRALLEGMPEETYTVYVESLVNKLLEKDRTLNQVPYRKSKSYNPPRITAACFKLSACVRDMRM